MVDDLFVALGIDEGDQCLHEVEGGDSLVASFVLTRGNLSCI